MDGSHSAGPQCCILYLRHQREAIFCTKKGNQWDAAVQRAATGGGTWQFAWRRHRGFGTGRPENPVQSDLATSRAKERGGGLQATARRRELKPQSLSWCCLDQFNTRILRFIF